MEHLVHIQDILFNRLAVWLNVLPLSFAFGAGILALLNPCGVALLPAYLALYIRGSQEKNNVDGEYSMDFTVELRRALLVSIVMAMSFLALFGIVGIVLVSGGQILIRYFPWLALLMGIILFILGISMLIGRSMYATLGIRLAAKVTIPQTLGIRSFFLFGIAYSIASLSCTLPIFLLVASNAISAEGFVSGLYYFASYVGGMGLMLIVVTLALAMFKTAMVGYLHRTAPYVHRAGSALVTLSGIYLICYWLIIGDIIR